MKKLFALLVLTMTIFNGTIALATEIDTSVWYDTNGRYITFDIEYAGLPNTFSWIDWEITTMKYITGKTNKCTIQKASVIYDRWFYIEVEGTVSQMMTDYPGSLQYQVLDSNGYVVKTGYISLYGMKKGDKFKKKDALYDCDITSYYTKYTIRFIDSD